MNMVVRWVRLAVSVVAAAAVVIWLLPTAALLPFLGDPCFAVARPAYWALRFRRSRDPRVIDALLLHILDVREEIACRAAWALQHNACEIHRSVERYQAVLARAAADPQLQGTRIVLWTLPFSSEHGLADLVMAIVCCRPGPDAEAEICAAATNLLGRLAESDGAPTEALIAVI